ncbi:MAG: hypothetical protein ACRD1J_08760, partial [Terriglobia bacterium]
ILYSTIATLERVFPAVFVYSRLPKSYMVFAFAENRSLASVQQDLQEARGRPALVKLAQAAASGMTDLKPPSGSIVFTDDHAPIDPMTRRMLIADRR